MDLKINITILSIIRVEQLLKTPFGALDFCDTEKMIQFLYCIAVSNNDSRMTLDEFVELCQNTHILQKLVKAFKKESECLALFQEFIEGTGKAETPTYVKDIIPTLIISGGLDIDYVLNEMSINDVPMYVEAYEKKKKEDLESKRLWTYISILPHIDGKKLKSPQDLYPFPWEVEAMKENALSEIDQNEMMLEQFLGGGIKFKQNGK